MTSSSPFSPPPSPLLIDLSSPGRSVMDGRVGPSARDEGRRPSPLRLLAKDDLRSHVLAEPLRFHRARFADDRQLTQVQVIPSRSTFTVAEKARTWYTHAELRQLRRQAFQRRTGLPSVRTYQTDPHRQSRAVSAAVVAETDRGSGQEREPSRYGTNENVPPAPSVDRHPNVRDWSGGWKLSQWRAERRIDDNDAGASDCTDACSNGRGTGTKQTTVQPRGRTRSSHGGGSGSNTVSYSSSSSYSSSNSYSRSNSYSNSYSNSSSNSYSNSYSREAEEESYRGLECSMNVEEKRRRMAMRLRAENAVLLEQQRQKEEGIQYIPELIADLYSHYANQSKMDALQRGLQDANVAMTAQQEPSTFSASEKTCRSKKERRLFAMPSWTRPLFLDPSGGVSC